MMIIHTYGEFKKDNHGNFDFIRNGFYYSHVNENGFAYGKISCVIGYFLGKTGIPEPSRVIVESQVIGKGESIEEYTINVATADLDFRNEFDYMVLCNNCISYLTTQGDKVSVLCEIETADCNFAHCEWCDSDNQYCENENDETLYLCHL